jgi:hypothetical protein
MKQSISTGQERPQTAPASAKTRASTGIRDFFTPASLVPRRSGFVRAAVLAVAFVVSFFALPWALNAGASDESAVRTPIETRTTYTRASDVAAAVIAAEAQVLKGIKFAESADYVHAMAWFLCAGETVEPAYWSSNAVYSMMQAVNALSRESYAQARSAATAECGITEPSISVANSRTVATKDTSTWETVVFRPGDLFVDAVRSASAFLGVKVSATQPQATSGDKNSVLSAVVSAAIWAIAIILAFYALGHVARLVTASNRWHSGLSNVTR